MWRLFGCLGPALVFPSVDIDGEDVRQCGIVFSEVCQLVEVHRIEESVVMCERAILYFS